MRDTAIMAAATVALFAGAATAANAGMINATVTADNHYAIYVDSAQGVTLVGGNERGAGGSPGTYNWSKAESYSFDTLGFIYIAVWSDDRIAQGLLADVRTSWGETLHSGDVRWDVMITDMRLVTGDASPQASTIANYAADADANNLWQTPFVGPGNATSTSPWGLIQGVAPEARWTWGNPNEISNPLVGSGTGDVMQIFRLQVPTPSAAGMGLGAMLMMLAPRRRRRPAGE